MVSKVFIDNDVIIDVLLQRRPFYYHSAQLFELAVENKVQLCISASSIGTIYYLIRRQHSHEDCLSLIRSLCLLATVLPTSAHAIEVALASKFKDFEDGIQHAVAIEAKSIDFFITRNIKDYTMASIPVATPENFLAST
jgi:predicted nucleic acid-binding protein